MQRERNLEAMFETIVRCAWNKHHVSLQLENSKEFFEKFELIIASGHT